MYMKRTIRKAPADVKALMRIANGIELELRALKREIEARRDAQVESHERLGNILETGTLFHHDGDGGEDLDEDDRAEAEAERAYQQEGGLTPTAPRTATFRP